MAAHSATTLVLFDVDGTLLLTGGAGVRAMNRAFESLHGVAEPSRACAWRAAPIRP